MKKIGFFIALVVSGFTGCSRMRAKRQCCGNCSGSERDRGGPRRSRCCPGGADRLPRAERCGSRSNVDPDTPDPGGGSTDWDGSLYCHPTPDLEAQPGSAKEHRPLDEWAKRPLEAGGRS